MVLETSRAVVARAWREADDVRAFELVARSGATLPTFGAGSHIDLHLAPHLVRQYSLCNGPEDRNHYLIGVKREPQSRGGSSFMFEQVRVGDELQVGAPRNNFPLDLAVSHSILLAGGIGVTPLLSMARHLAAASCGFQLEYFTRSPEHAAFRDLLAGPDLSSRVTIHEGLDLRHVDARLRQVLSRHRADGKVYLCGPLPFMDMARGVAAALVGRPARSSWNISRPARPRCQKTTRMRRSRSSSRAPAWSMSFPAGRASSRPWPNRASRSPCPVSKVYAAPVLSGFFRASRITATCI